VEVRGLPFLNDGEVLGFAVPVAESSQVGEARRLVVACARRLGFDETAAGKAAILATEMAGNLVKHAGGGEMVVRPLAPPANGAARGLEILALDRGPGIADVAKSLRDGYSTAGSPGTGLGAMARLSDRFDLYSAAGQGTALLSQLWPKAEPRAGAVGAREPTELGAVCLPVAGEEAPGDGWEILHRPGGWRLLVSDGLGHGLLAREPSQRAAEVFRELPADPPAQVLEACHAALHGTRGAAVAMADVDLDAGVVRFAGIGNVTGSILGEGPTQYMVSLNGIVGPGPARFREFTYPWSPGALLVMASDGLSTRWKLDSYPGLAGRHPGLIAGVLYRDHGRPRDDVTVVAVRAAQPPRAAGGESR
jgi:anti-sigma regulatory factor (Ser/Thr protein kinase)